jgi:hypothetical protein
VPIRAVGVHDGESGGGGAGPKLRVGESAVEVGDLAAVRRPDRLIHTATAIAYKDTVDRFHGTTADAETLDAAAGLGEQNSSIPDDSLYLVRGVRWGAGAGGVNE